MGPEELRHQFSKAYRRILTPLVRILIRNGITAVELGDWVRQVFVETATTDEFELPGRRLSDTRVAILTGLSRKEVHRIRNEDYASRAGTNLSRVARVIAGWNQDPDYTGPYGLPLAVPFEDDPTVDALSFCELVRRYSGDMAPRAMLDELVRTGLAEVDDDGFIRNTGRTYIPNQLDPAAIERLGRVLSRLADTLDFNNRPDTEEFRRFERNVVTDIGLTDEQFRQFSIYLQEKCQQLLETLDNWLAMQEGRIGPNRPRERLNKKKVVTGIGIYHFLDEEKFEERDIESSSDSTKKG